MSQNQGEINRQPTSTSESEIDFGSEYENINIKEEPVDLFYNDQDNTNHDTIHASQSYMCDNICEPKPEQNLSPCSDADNIKVEITEQQCSNSLHVFQDVKPMDFDNYQNVMLADDTKKADNLSTDVNQGM